MPVYSQMVTGTYSATNKAFDATNPKRSHYHFRGWSFTSGENQEVINNGSDGNDDDYRPRLLCSDFRNNEGHTHEVEAVYNETDKGYFELTVYAIWESMIVYTLTYDLNQDGKYEAFPLQYGNGKWRLVHREQRSADRMLGVL